MRRPGPARLAVALGVVIGVGISAVAGGPPAGATFEKGDVTLVYSHLFDGGTAHDSVNGVDFYDGRVYTVGTTEGTIDTSSGGFDYFYAVNEDGGDPVYLDQGATSQTDRGAAIDAGSWGAVVLGDTTGNLASPNYGSYDLFVRRYRPDNTIAWTTQVGSAAADFPADVAVIGGTVYTVQTSYVDASNVSGIVRAFDLATGAQNDQLVIDAVGRDDITGIAAAPDGDLVIGGSTYGTLPGGGGAHGGQDSFLMRLDRATLDRVWTRQFGTADDDRIDGVATRGSTIYWGGTYGHDVGGSSTTDAQIGSFTAGGTTRWKHLAGTDRGYGVDVVTHRDGVVLAGQTIGAVASEPGEGVDGFLQGYSAGGSLRWTSRVGGNDFESLGDVAYGRQGLVVGGVTRSNAFGYVNNPDDAFIAVLAGHDPRAQLKVGRSGFGQQKRLQVRRGHVGVATLRIRNEGDSVERLLVIGCRAPAGVSLVIKQGRRAVTGQVRSGHYLTPALAPGQDLRFTLRLTATPRAAVRASLCKLTVVSTYQRRAKQSAKLIIAVRS